MSLRFEDFELLGKLDDDGLWETWLARGLSREQGAPPLAFIKRIPQGRATIRELISLHRQVGRAAAIRHRNLIPILSHGKIIILPKKNICHDTTIPAMGCRLICLFMTNYIKPSTGLLFQLKMKRRLIAARLTG